MNATAIRFCRTCSRLAAIFAVLSGFAVLLGWILDQPLLKAVFIHGPTMKANAASCLVLAGLSLLLLLPEVPGRATWRTIVGRLFALVVLAVALLTFLEHVTGRNFGIDEILFVEPAGELATASPGRMGPPASLSLTLISLALLMLDMRVGGKGVPSRERAPSQWIAILIAFIALIPLIGYAYGIQSLYTLPRYTGIALHTAIALFMLGLGVIAARPTRGAMAVVSADDAGGIMARRLIGPAILVPLIFGWLRTIGEEYNLFDAALGRPLLILSIITTFVAMVWWNARTMSVLGHERTRAELERERLLSEVGEQHRRAVGALSALRDSEARLSAILNNAPAMVYVVDAQHRFQFINRRWEGVFNIVNDQTTGKSIYDFFPKDIADQFAANNRRVLDDQLPAEIEEIVPHGDGMHTYISVKVPLFDADGEAYAVCGISTDITDRKRAENALRESEHRLQLALAIAEMGTFEIDLQTDVVRVNDAGRAIYGWKKGEALTFSKVQSHFHPDDKARVLQAVEAAFHPSGPGEFEVEQRILHADGAVRWIRVRGRAMFAEPIGGERSERAAVRCVGTYLDITHAKEAERQRERLLVAERAAREEAERASTMKDEFLATLSHELRTPLTPVLLTASMMERHPRLPMEFRDDVTTIRRNVELESRLISDLLDLTRVAKGKLQLDIADVNLHEVVRAAVDICQREAAARQVVDLRARNHFVRGDPTRLQQIFWNLLNNANKFTGADGTVTVRSRNVDGDRIRVEVIDTGAGIDPAILPRLFTAFEQGQVRAVRQHAGLGLGLAISRQLTEAQGGTIAAYSEGPGKGATFSVEFPVLVKAGSDGADGGMASATSAENGGGQKAQSLSVLVVEDHEATLDILSRLLRGMGHRVTGATSVATATATAEATADGGFDLIISDLGLPDGSGIDIMRQLRGRYDQRAIALTGYGMDSDIAASRAAGFAEHITKPVDLEQLKQAIRRVAG